MEYLLVTGGGRIRCLRCTARSRRTGLQCGRPAMKSSRGQKCRFHGGMSTGPRSEAGKQRIREAHWVHGERSAAGVERASKVTARIRGLADAVQILWGVKVANLYGRKPNGYHKLHDVDDIRRFLAELVGEME